MNKISQDQAEKIIDAPLAALILESVLSGFQDYYSKINEETQAILSATARASIINDFMVYHARDKIQITHGYVLSRDEDATIF